VYFITLIESCVFHSSAQLLKKVPCIEVKKIGLIYKYAKRNGKNANYSFPYFEVDFDSKNIEKIQNDYCEIIEFVKKARLRNNESSSFAKREKEFKESEIYLTSFAIVFYREKDAFSISPLSGYLKFEYYGVSYRGYSNHSDKLWEYASKNYFIDFEVQDKLVEFANKMIVYRNAKVKSDITLSDSLRQPYPLIILPK
jgi:hypothetical protein